MKPASSLILIVAMATVATPSAVADLDPVTVALEQPDAPVRLEEYEAEYKEGGQNFFGGRIDRGIHHEVKVRNLTDRKIVAVGVTFVVFNVFDEYLDRTNGIAIGDIDPGDDEGIGWVASAYRGFSFHTGVTFVRKVRFEDGEVWSSDLGEIGRKLEEFGEDFDVSVLTEREEDGL